MILLLVTSLDSMILQKKKSKRLDSENQINLSTLIDILETRHFLTIPETSHESTGERVFSFVGLTLSDLRKSLFEGKDKWGSPSIHFRRGDLQITHPELCDYRLMFITG
jgi:hypothetical protein